MLREEEKDEEQSNQANLHRKANTPRCVWFVEEWLLHLVPKRDDLSPLCSQIQKYPRLNNRVGIKHNELLKGIERKTVVVSWKNEKRFR